MSDSKSRALDSYRFLDLTDDKGFLCSKMLADLGAEVIKVEQPGGDPSRNIGPFYHDIVHPEKSLYWFVYNANKKGITINIKTSDGKQIFERLVGTSDGIIESFPVGYMDEIGLGYSALSLLNPGIIMTSVTPFGQVVPYKNYKASSLVGLALGGGVYLTGDDDRAPLYISVPQAYLLASEQAAAGTMIALYHRELSGEGQQVDVSMYESVILTTLNAIPLWELYHLILPRVGPYRVGLSTTAKQRQTWQCKDGYVTFIVLGGVAGASTSRALVEWMDSEGMANDFLKQMDWDAFDMVTATQEVHNRLEEHVGKFFLRHTKAELYEGAIKRRIMLYPVSDIKDIAEDLQLKSRDFWIKIEYSELADFIISPGAFVKASETPCRMRYRAPLIGEHNEEIFQELGISKSDMIMLKQAGAI
ncbi:MAG: CoA transferase [Chloroflexota bacterium]|nr:CoA transferase [Chloroflexota bacterium]